VNFTVLTIGTIIIVLFSWYLSIKHGRYHGIPRFFSFESIFIMVLMNLNVWFRHPFSLVQIVSWILLILSAYVAVEGFLQLKKFGKSDKNFENTSNLVKSGLYRYIRHPMYCSLLLLGTGVMFKDPGFVQLMLGAVNFTSLIFTARIEEKEMLSKFGEQYSDYIRETKMFVPYIV